jgi:hypothetical protein
MALLTLDNYYCINSQDSMSNVGSNEWTLDDYAQQQIILSATKTVLVIYAPNCADGDEMDAAGFRSAISIDTVNGGDPMAISCQSPDEVDESCRALSFWIGSLESGTHNIGGYLHNQVDDDKITITNRTLLVVIFDGNEFGYTDSTVETTALNSFVQVPSASYNIVPSVNCKVLYLANISNRYDGSSVEYAKGKILQCLVDTVEQLQVAQAGAGTNLANSSDSQFIAFAQALTTSGATFNAKFKGYSGTVNVRTFYSQSGYLCFANSVLLDVLLANYLHSFSGTAFSNDKKDVSNDAIISRKAGGDFLCLAIGTKRQDDAGTDEGGAYGLKINTTDKSHSRSSAYATDSARSNQAVWMEYLTPANNQIIGRVATNISGTGQTESVYTRIIISLCFNPEPFGAIPKVVWFE